MHLHTSMCEVEMGLFKKYLILDIDCVIRLGSFVLTQGSLETGQLFSSIWLLNALLLLISHLVKIHLKKFSGGGSVLKKRIFYKSVFCLVRLWQEAIKCLIKSKSS